MQNKPQVEKVLPEEKSMQAGSVTSVYPIVDDQETNNDSSTTSITQKKYLKVHPKKLKT